MGTLDYKYCLCVIDLFLLEGNCLLYRGKGRKKREGNCYFFEFLNFIYFFFF